MRTASAAWYSSRLDRPVCADTSAAASFMRVPVRTSSSTSVTASGRETARTSAPATTTTSSPRTPASAHAAS
ncbi:MAG: hypothetical protein J0J00_06270, partial [Microbacterium sp.]|nr:hypothetical protein [Microbacterium sp.]